LGIWIGYLALPSQSATASIPELELRQLWATRVSFTNQNQDTSPQLYDFLYREYNPYQGGRWASPDPAGLGAVDITDPQTLNRYAYVGNRPLTYVDPLGLNAWDERWGGWGGWTASAPIDQVLLTISWESRT